MHELATGYGPWNRNGTACLILLSLLAYIIFHKSYSRISCLERVS